MTNFSPPSISSSNEPNSPRTTSEQSEKSFRTARGREDKFGEKMGINEDVPMSGNEGLGSNYTTEMRILLEKMEQTEKRNNAEIERMRSDMKEMMGLMQGIVINQNQNFMPTQDTFKANPISETHNENIKDNNQKIKPLTWPEAYDHSDQTKWNTTYGLLKYIYKRDVEERGFLLPADFFMQLYSLAVSGTAKEMVTGLFEEMMASGRTTEALELLEGMDNMFRDQNAEQTAATLLHACKQFRDENLASFLPRFQQLLNRSPISNTEDKNKVFCLKNAINQTTKKHLIGRSLPSRFQDFMKYLSIIGCQIEEANFVKTKKYIIGQTGTFDDGTRGIAGGKLLGGYYSIPQYRPSSNSVNNYDNNDKDADGDTKMTGVNRMRAKWVTKSELNRRRKEGNCVRCGKKGHRVPNCPFLPPQHPETEINVSSSSVDEKFQDDINSNEIDEALKE